MLSPQDYISYPSHARYTEQDVSAIERAQFILFHLLYSACSAATECSHRVQTLECGQSQVTM
jgi:hypothetical protein